MGYKLGLTMTETTRPRRITSIRRGLKLDQLRRGLKLEISNHLCKATPSKLTITGPVSLQLQMWTMPQNRGMISSLSQLVKTNPQLRLSHYSTKLQHWKKRKAQRKKTR